MYVPFDERFAKLGGGVRVRWILKGRKRVWVWDRWGRGDGEEREREEVAKDYLVIN